MIQSQAPNKLVQIFFTEVVDCRETNDRPIGFGNAAKENIKQVLNEASDIIVCMQHNI